MLVFVSQIHELPCDVSLICDCGCVCVGARRLKDLEVHASRPYGCYEEYSTRILKSDMPSEIPLQLFPDEREREREMES